MAQDFLLLRQFVSSLVRRERSLLAVQIGARTALLLLAALCWAVISAASHLERPAAALVLTVIIGVGAWFSVTWPLLSWWADSADPLRQARQVEGLVPALGGRLVTAMAHPSGAAGGESAEILALLVSRARSAVQSVRPEDVHPSRGAVRSAGVAAAGWLAGIVLLVAVGPSDVASFWFQTASAYAGVGTPEVKTSEDVARVGDLVLTYTYPDYTGLPPKTVPNSTGDVTGPPGTRVAVSARSGDAVEAAGLVAYEEPLEALVDPDGRTVSGSFSIRSDPGTWRLLLYRRGEPQPSRAFSITPEEDLPPDVVLEEQGTIEVALDEPIDIHWQARDDFGVRKVVVARDGKDTDRILEQPEGRRAEVTGHATLYPRDLGLSPGDRVKLSVAAWDNDTVSGSKRGESRAVEIVVLGASGLDARANERRQQLLDVMLPILAGMLTDPDPPGTTGGALARWGEEVAVRYRPLSETVERLWTDQSTRSPERSFVEDVLGTARKLVRYTQVSFEPSSTELVRPEAQGMVASMRDASVLALEDAILALAQMIESEAMAEIAEQAADLASSAEALAEAARDPQTSLQELAARLDQTDRLMSSLSKATEKLQESGLREFVKMRQSEITNLRDEVNRALAEERMDDARRLSQRLSGQVEELASGITDQMSRRQQEASDAQQRAEDLKAALEQLEKDQRALQAEVQALQQQDQGSAQAVEDLWKRIEAKVEAHQKDARGYVTGLEAGERPFFEVERARAGADEADRLRAAVEVRDLTGARISLEQERMAWGAVEGAARMMLRHGQRFTGPGVAEVQGIRTELEEISDLLDQLEARGSQVDPRTLERSQQLEGQQDQLQSRLEQLQGQAEELVRDFPVRPKGLGEALDDAENRMGQASEDLGEGQPMQAEGSQGVAAQRIRDARDAIEQAQRQAAMQAQPSSGGERGEEGDGEGDQRMSSMESRRDLEIPRRDEYVPPAEYRRLLLEGMEGEVPEEYRALKQRYFEELVHQ